MTGGSERTPLWRRLLGYGERFDLERENNLDFMRFAAASLVLLDHSFPLTRRPGLGCPLSFDTYGELAVAVFFVMSGFLVASSWERNPRLRPFARKRALRIVPGYAGVLVFAALLLGPAITDLRVSEYFANSGTWSYFKNLTFVKLSYGLPGVFVENPYPRAVNGSIWTLPIEVFMYLSLAALGVLGLLRRWFVTPLILAIGLAWSHWFEQLRASHYFVIDVLPAWQTVRLALWFGSGCLLWLWRGRVRYRADLAALLLAACIATDGTGRGYRVIHLAVPYLILWFARLRVPGLARFGRYGDFSYGMYLYAFPIQQTVAWLGGARWPLAAYIGVCFVLTLACAVLSWHLVERPALRHKVRAAPSPASAAPAPADAPPLERAGA